MKKTIQNQNLAAVIAVLLGLTGCSSDMSLSNPFAWFEGEPLTSSGPIAEEKVNEKGELVAAPAAEIEKEIAERREIPPSAYEIVDQGGDKNEDESYPSLADRANADVEREEILSLADVTIGTQDLQGLEQDRMMGSALQQNIETPVPQTVPQTPPQTEVTRIDIPAPPVEDEMIMPPVAQQPTMLQQPKPQMVQTAQTESLPSDQILWQTPAPAAANLPPSVPTLDQQYQNQVQQYQATNLPATRPAYPSYQEVPNYPMPASSGTMTPYQDPSMTAAQFSPPAMAQQVSSRNLGDIYTRFLAQSAPTATTRPVGLGVLGFDGERLPLTPVPYGSSTVVPMVVTAPVVIPDPYPSYPQGVIDTNAYPIMTAPQPVVPSSYAPSFYQAPQTPPQPLMPYRSGAVDSEMTKPIQLAAADAFYRGELNPAKEEMMPQTDDQLAFFEGHGQHVATIHFNRGSSKLSQHDLDVLRSVAEAYKKKGGTLQVIGHASQFTTAKDPLKAQFINFDLSMKRAEAVAKALGKMGIKTNDMTVQAKASQDPVFDEANRNGQVGNQRVEIFWQAGRPDNAPLRYQPTEKEKAAEKFPA